MRHPAPRTARLLLTLALAGGTVLAPSLVEPARAAPSVRISKVVGGLNIPWDVTWVGDTMLYNERSGVVWAKRGSAAPVRVSLPLPRIWAKKEGGLLGMVADPAAASNRLFYTCQSVAASADKAQDVQVWKWKLAADGRSATKEQVLIKGIPINTGRHNGCRMRFRSAGMLYVGTGDAAQGANPQNLKSLGGKILRVRSDGSIPSSNPFYAKGGNARYVWSYGHRNVQGLAKRPGISELWSAEHGSDRDDEVNWVVKSSNYGWSPTPGYDESKPMTDLKRFPKARSAKWRSGKPTVATSGATFLDGKQWGSWNGRLTVAMLKGQGILTFSVSKDLKLTRKETIATSYGRIRTVEQGPDGALYFLTANGGDDGLYRATLG